MEETTGSRLYVAYWFKTKQTVKAFSLMSWRGAADRGYWPVSKWKITSHKELSGACWPCDDELKAMGSSVTAWPLQRVCAHTQGTGWNCLFDEKREKSSLSNNESAFASLDGPQRSQIHADVYTQGRQTESRKKKKKKQRAAQSISAGWPDGRRMKW